MRVLMFLNIGSFTTSQSKHVLKSNCVYSISAIMVLCNFIIVFTTSNPHRSINIINNLPTSPTNTLVCCEQVYTTIFMHISPWSPTVLGTYLDQHLCWTCQAVHTQGS